MIHFIGDSHAALTLKEATHLKGIPLTRDIATADVVFVSQDTPTDELGHRDQSTIEDMIQWAIRKTIAPICVTSQLEPGTCRRLNLPIYHMAETLRVADGSALWRALNPEQFIIGCRNPVERLPYALWKYLRNWQAPILKMSWESAECAKICINMRLAHMVESTNLLSDFCHKAGGDWNRVKVVLQHDKRVGAYSYLEPGDWRQSKHLLRDWVTYQECKERQ